VRRPARLPSWTDHSPGPTPRHRPRRWRRTPGRGRAPSPGWCTPGDDLGGEFLLEPGLEVESPGAVAFDRITSVQWEDHPSGRLETGVEIHRRQQRLHGVPQDRSLVLPPDCRSPIPSRMCSPTPRRRATRASSSRFTQAARILASSPSRSVGKLRRGSRSPPAEARHRRGTPSARCRAAPDARRCRSGGRAPAPADPMSVKAWPISAARRSSVIPPRPGSESGRRGRVRRLRVPSPVRS
jgi:hypothetical protein